MQSKCSRSPTARSHHWNPCLARLPMSRSHRSRCRRPCAPAIDRTHAGLFGKLIVPAPAALKGSARGPLRALDRFGRGHGLTITTGVAALRPVSPILS